MPKTTSTPTASRDRTRLCAPVRPVSGSAAASSTERAVVSTPVSASAASRVADPLGVVLVMASPGGACVMALLSAGRPGTGPGGGRGGCLGRGAAAGGRRSGPVNERPPVPAGTEGSARRSGGTDALGDYEDQAGRAHGATVRLDDAGRQPGRPTVWDRVSSDVGQEPGIVQHTGDR